MRRLVAFLLLVAVGWLESFGHPLLPWFFALGGALFFGRSALAQTLARGVAWFPTIPIVTVQLIMLFHRGFVLPGWYTLATLGAAVTALVVAHPLVDEEAARASFTPLAMRRWFLASATASVATGIALSSYAHIIGSWALAAIGAAFVAAGVGLARMRSWGVFAGAAASALALTVGGSVFPFAAITLATAIPGAMMVGGVLAARAAMRKRVCAAEALVELPARVRIDVGTPKETHDEPSELPASDAVVRERCMMHP